MMPTEFTPVTSLLGGALIGLAAVFLMLSLGRIMGATGILAGVVMPASRSEFLWRAAVLAGMLSGPWIYRVLLGKPLAIDIPSSSPMIIIGGLLVGIGVVLGSGCTSGHGVCGLARQSGRSLVAVLVFMASTVATVYITRHLLGLGAA